MQSQKDSQTNIEPTMMQSLLSQSLYIPDGVIIYQDRACNKSAPSQATMPTTIGQYLLPHLSQYLQISLIMLGITTLWLAIVCQVGSRSTTGTAKFGATGLISALRMLFSTFSVPEEISSDGGSEFSASMTADFFLVYGKFITLYSEHITHSPTGAPKLRFKMRNAFATYIQVLSLSTSLQETITKYCAHTHCKSAAPKRTYPGTRIVP